MGQNGLYKTAICRRFCRGRPILGRAAVCFARERTRGSLPWPCLEASASV